MTDEFAPAEQLLPLDQLESMADHHGGRAAVRDLSRPHLTFAALHALSERLRRQVAAAGVAAGEALAISISNRADAAIWITALAGSCRCLPIAPSMSAGVVTMAFRALDVRAVIADAQGLGNCAEAIAATGAAVLTPQSVGPWAWEIEGRAGPVAPRHRHAEAEDVAFYLTTSGSTGLPKIVPVRHQAVALATSRAARGLDLAPGEATLNVMQLNHVHGLVSGVYLPWVAAACSIMPGEYTAADFVDWYRAAQPTWVSTSPAIYADVLRRARQGGLSLRQPRLRFLRCGSAALDDGLRAEISTAFGAPLLEAYGMSEALIIAGVPARDPRQGTVGRPVADELAVFGPDNQPCAPDGAGEIRVRGRTVMPGYVGDAAGSVVFHDGWFRTGDMGRIDADGFLHVIGRIGDRINMGGETVAPAEIEAAIRRIPGVQACLCFGLPHDTLGETIAAAVVPDEGAPLRPEDIRAEAARHLPRAKVPAKIFLMEKLPLDANGKINRRHLASTLAAKLSHSSGPDDVALDPFEAWMLELFRSMLRRPDLGPAENFFDAGGTSLDATETMLRIEQHLGVTVHLPLLFDAPTATGLALAIRERFPDMTIRLFPLAVAAARPAAARDAQMMDVRGPVIAPRTQDRSDTSPLIILSAPRAGSTLLRTALAGHPGFFSPPELRLLTHERMDDWARVHSGKFRFFQDGLVQAIMSATGEDEGSARAWIDRAIAARLSVERVYDHLQHAVGDRRIVEKSPHTALSPSALGALETRFRKPLYVVLRRNPVEAIRSHVAAGLDQVWMQGRVDHPRALAEAVWTESYCNISAFVQNIDPRRVLTIHFEDLVTDPDEWLTRLCKFAKRPFVPAMLDVHDQPEKRMSTGLRGSRRGAGDPSFWRGKGIDPGRAGLGHGLPADAAIAPETAVLAARFGYQKPGRKDPAPIIAAQREMVRPWSEHGSPLGDLIHTFRPETDAPPLLWICQSIHEPVALARALDILGAPGVSLHALRSGNLLASRYDRAIEDLADAYADRIDTLWPEGAIRLAGNCQGADIAKGVARRLLARGREVPVLLAVDPDFHGPLAVPVAHIFGASSHRNPFLRPGCDPHADWEKMYPAHSVDTLPCGHGQYFSAEIVPLLAGLVKKILAASG